MSDAIQPDRTEPPPPPAPESHPLLAPWSGPFGGVPPWHLVEAALFPSAFVAAIALQREEIAAITRDPAAPTFANTIEALERAGRPLGRVAVLFGVMTSNLNTPEYQHLDRELSPVLAAAEDTITFDETLFSRVAAVHATRATAGLTDGQQRLTERRYDAFVRQGATLPAAEKTELSRINQALATAFSDFATRVLAEEDTWTVLEGDSDLAGLPASLVAAYRAAADERQIAGRCVVVHTRSSVDPFLTFSSRRDLRQRIWTAFKHRGDNGGPNDTNGLIARIVTLRAERAALLGFQSHAHWRMDDSMARDPEAAVALMLRVWAPAVARVREEVAAMQAIAEAETPGITIEPWDYLYYAEHVRRERYALDSNELKPYLDLNNMIAASYAMAQRLYGLTFTEISGAVPVFHPDVRVYEVTDTVSGRHVGLFYRDDFARQYKRSGAWASAYRDQRLWDGPVTAIASNNNNFVKGGPGEPVLISLDDTRTLFHEFGHALHALLMQVTYPGLADTPRDFVELPSQVHEHWILTRDILDTYATHYQTKAPMPQALVDKVTRASTFNQGYATVEYLAPAILDMRLHTRPGGLVDPAQFERETLAAIGTPREVAMRHRLAHFTHLFASDSYSAGYYSYLWADVMASDTWAAFEEGGGPWAPEVADAFRRLILATGNSIDRADAYRQFRGRDPEVAALLRHRGFPTDARR